MLWDLSANGIKEVAHAVIVFLLRDTDIGTPATVEKPSHTQPVENESRIRTVQSLAENKGREGREFGTGVANQRISDRSCLVEEAVQYDFPQEDGFVGCDNLAKGGVGDEDFPRPFSKIVFAFRAHIQVSSVVLHFRAKGLRPGTFLLQAYQGDSLSVGCSVVKSVDGDGGEARTRWDDGGSESVLSRRGADPEQVTAGVSLWVTNESAPLVQGLNDQWAEADATAVGGCPGRDLEEASWSSVSAFRYKTRHGLIGPPHSGIKTSLPPYLVTIVGHSKG